MLHMLYNCVMLCYIYKVFHFMLCYITYVMLYNKICYNVCHVMLYNM